MRVLPLLLVLALLVSVTLAAGSRRNKSKRAKGAKNGRNAQNNQGPKTGGGEECKDKVEHCFRARTQCQTPALAETLKKNCAKSCGHCVAAKEPTKEANECRDVSPK